MSAGTRKSWPPSTCPSARQPTRRMIRVRTMRSNVVVMLLLLGGASTAAAQTDSVTMPASTRYQRSGFAQAFFGHSWRNAWSVPIRVPVLDLGTYAGGLEPYKEGGGSQTKSL